MEQPGSKEIEMGRSDESAAAESYFDGEEAEVKGGAPYFRRRKRACACCCAISCCLLVLFVIVVVILAFTVFKPKKPRVEVLSVDLEGFKVNFDLTLPPEISINLTVGVVLSIVNPNKVSFRYSNSTANLLYRDEEVGTVPIPAGAIGADGEEIISTAVTLLADRLITNLHLVSDLLSGSIPFSTTTFISGRVNILNIIKRHVNIFTQCDITVLVSGSLNSTVCNYHTEF